MFIIDSYSLAVAFTIVTMLCWGSWANTMKLASKNWPFTLYYWDYSLGLIILALIFGITLGSNGEQGQPFFENLLNAHTGPLIAAFTGGIIFNLSNLLIVAATAVAGMSVAFPVAVGLALVIGVFVNYLKQPEGNPLLLFLGVTLVVAAIVINALAYKRMPASKGGASTKGILLSIASGIIMGFFYRFVAESMSMNFASPEPGKLTPYAAVFVFSIGIFLSNFLWNTLFMYPAHKLVNEPRATYRDYFTLGTLKLHLIGILGGIIWNVGMSFSLIAAEKAGPAISYGLGQGATMIAAAWGVFIWKEFRQAPKGTGTYLASMFMLFLSGLALIILAKL